MALATKCSPQATVGAPLYQTDNKPLTVIGIRAANTRPLDAGESIDMVKVPAGARIIDAGVFVSGAADTTEADMGLYDCVDQGTYNDIDGLLDGVNLDTGILHRADVGTVPVDLFKKLTLDCYVRLSIVTADLDDAIDVYVWVTYIMP